MQTDVGLIIAIVGSAVAMIGVVIAMMFWVRQESNTLRGEANTLRGEANADRRDIVNLIIAIKEDMKDFHTQLQLQDKEFKMRLCAIEEKRIRGN